MNQAGSGTSASRSPLEDRRQRLGDLRHDLRNPLGEILGFTEMLTEEASEQQIEPLVAGLDAVQRSANQILADLNHALNPETGRVNPDSLRRLNEIIQQGASTISELARQMITRCGELQQPAWTEDFARIIGSADRLQAIATAGMEPLILSVIGSEALGSTESAPGLEMASRDSTPQNAIRMSGNVLVVDDQEPNRSLLARRLQKRGYSVALAENGRHAMENLRSRRFDLVLLDIVMPEMNGLEVLQAMKADPNLAHIPVLMLSAVDDLDAVVHCIALGAEDHLTKPFPTAILQARVEACLARKRMSDQLRKYTEWLFGKSLFSNAVGAPGSFGLSRQERTILFADIRGFTQWSEAHSPEEAVSMLNAYFENAEQLWRDSSVIKTEYTGDEIMCVFPAPDDAVRIGQLLRTELGRLLDAWNLGIGVGVHTGVVIEGLLGGADVKAYRFVGDAVNTARRICTEAKAGQFLLSDTTYSLSSGVPVLERSLDILMKGKLAPAKVWQVAGASGGALASGKDPNHTSEGT